MQIKTYKAPSMKEVLAQIKTEMGPHAVIVSTRQVQDDTYGIMAKPVVEVTAAVDYDQMRTVTTKTPGPSKPSPVAAAAPAVDVNGDLIHMNAEITELKGMMQALLRQNGVEVKREDPLRETLVAKGIRPALIDRILAKLGQQASLATVKALLHKVVRTDPQTTQPIRIFLGTTGVGKTTTIAKLAARAALNEGQRVALVTLDTYRIGAVEQGRIYAKILGVPFVSVSTPDEFRRAIVQYRTMDLILVDTVGRAPTSDESIAQLGQYCEGLPLAKFLLMPVATRDTEMERITQAFAPLGIDRMIFTKADEAVVAGTVISHNLLFRTPIAYITNGQRVPEDIVAADPEQIITMCLGELT